MAMSLCILLIMFVIGSVSRAFFSADVDDWAVAGTDDLPHVPYTPRRYTEEEMLERSKHFYTLLNERRSVRFISPEPVSRDVIDNVIRAAGTLCQSETC